MVSTATKNIEIGIDTSPTQEQHPPAQTEPTFMGGEFVVSFLPGPLGMELEEFEGCLKVVQIVKGGQASYLDQIRVGTIVVGAEGFPITTLEDLNQVLEALAEVS